VSLAQINRIAMDQEAGYQGSIPLANERTSYYL
jgi:hypothetical protein